MIILLLLGAGELDTEWKKKCMGIKKGSTAVLPPFVNLKF